MREITHGRVGNVQICQESEELEESNESEERDGGRAGTRGQMHSFDKREQERKDDNKDEESTSVEERMAMQGHGSRRTASTRRRVNDSRSGLHRRPNMSSYVMTPSDQMSAGRP